MKWSIDTRQAVLMTTFGIGLAALVIYISERERKSDLASSDGPLITDESIMVAYSAYKSAMDEKESQSTLSELNAALKDEFGVTVAYRPLRKKYVVYDGKGKLLKELDA